jgi:hypothetical protein
MRVSIFVEWNLPAIPPDFAVIKPDGPIASETSNGPWHVDALALFAAVS